MLNVGRERGRERVREGERERVSTCIAIVGGKGRDNRGPSQANVGEHVSDQLCVSDIFAFRFFVKWRKWRY